MQEAPRSEEGLSRYVDRFRNRRVLVVGDLMLDEYVSGTVERISPEAPVAVVSVTSTEHRLGGAANVTHNIASLGAGAALAGVVGDDGWGRMFREKLEGSGIEVDALVVDPGRPTTVKTRVIAQKQQIVRYDRESAEPLPAPVAATLLKKIKAELEEVQAVVLSDYAKGVLSPSLVAGVIGACQKAGKPVLVDPKIRNFEAFRGATVITPNFKEAKEAASLVAGIHVTTQGDLERAAAKLLEKMEVDSLVVTKGEHGMYLFTPGEAPLHIPTAAREVYDVSGAGDTVIATLALALAAGASLPEAAMLANHAAGVVVAKFGTAVVSEAELKASLLAEEEPTRAERPARKKRAKR